MAPAAALSRIISCVVLADRIEPAGRLVEDQQFGPGHEGGAEADLLAVALGLVSGRLVEV